MIYVDTSVRTVVRNRTSVSTVQLDTHVKKGLSVISSHTWRRAQKAGTMKPPMRRVPTVLQQTTHRKMSLCKIIAMYKGKIDIFATLII